MRRRLRQEVHELAGRLLGERTAPIGGVARDRRILRHALRGQPVGRVLVIGPGLAARQAWPDARVDVAGTSPYSAEVTVCSTALGAGSLPPARWDTVVISAVSDDLAKQLAAVQPACRAGARLLVLDRQGWAAHGPQARALAEAVSINDVISRRRQRVWVAEVHS